MDRVEIPGQDAWKAAASKPASRWYEHIARFKEELAVVHHDPKFRLNQNERFFCIGSCFARNIEEHLIYQGVEVLSKRIVSPKLECGARVNGFVNKFTTHSMLNEIEWALEQPEIDENFFEETSNGWNDPQLAPGISAVSLERAIERRKYLIEQYFSRLYSATVIVLTLGLNEVWYDKQSSRYLNCAPSFFATRRNPDRFTLRITDCFENIEQLEAIRSLILKINKQAKLIVTVSPVPLSETFSGRDIVVANTYSKSTLRVAAEAFSARHDNVDYFPSYDMIAISPRDLAYGVDCLHVSDRVVGRVMREFLRLYMDLDVGPQDFTELGYLAANPDVEEAVRLAIFSSGFEHWTKHGKSEGRAIAPVDGPTELMIAAGVVNS